MLGLPTLLVMISTASEKIQSTHSASTTPYSRFAARRASAAESLLCYIDLWRSERTSLGRRAVEGELHKVAETAPVHEEHGPHVVVPEELTIAPVTVVIPACDLAILKWAQRSR